MNTSDDSGEMPNWLKWVIGAVVIVGLAIATVVTAGGFAAAGVAIAGAFTGTSIGGVAGFFAAATLGAVVGSGVGLLGGGLTSVINGGSFGEGAADGFMWGAVSGVLGGGLSGIIGKSGAIGKHISDVTKLVSQAIGQSVISFSTYIGQTYSNGNKTTLFGIATSIFSGVTGGLTSLSPFSTQLIISSLNEGLKASIEYLKKCVRDLVKIPFNKESWFW